MEILKEQGVSFSDEARDIMNLAYDDTDESRTLFEKKIKAAQNNQMLKVAIIMQYKAVTKVAFVNKPLHWCERILTEYGFI